MDTLELDSYAQKILKEIASYHLDNEKRPICILKQEEYYSDVMSEFKITVSSFSPREMDLGVITEEDIVKWRNALNVLREKGLTRQGTASSLSPLLGPGQKFSIKEIFYVTDEGKQSAKKLSQIQIA
jgi:hypothetical protein